MSSSSIHICLGYILCGFALLVVSAYGQLSLDQMIDKLKNENGIVFNSAGPPPQSFPVNQNAQLNVGPSGVSIDNRFDPRISELVSNRVLQLAHSISILFRDQMVKNSVISPVSIAGALSLVLLGANGRTFSEVMRLFGFDNDQALLANPYKIHEEFGLLIEDLLSDSQTPSRPRPLNNWKYMVPKKQRASVGGPNDLRQYHEITVANGIFHQRGFSLRPSYEDAVHEIYRSEVVSLDFRGNIDMAKKYINDWVKSRTRGKIEQIIGAEINSNTRLMIASALYFKALWDQTFIDGATNKKNFYPNGVGAEPILVDMMAHGGEFPFYDAKEYDCRILGFPYRGNLTTMYIILPNNSSRQRLREIQTYLTPDRIEDMISKMTLKTAIILFPKLHIQNSVDLKSAFQRLGLSSLFDPLGCDLSLVSDGQVISFSNMKKPAAGFVHSNPMDPKIPVYQPEIATQNMHNDFTDSGNRSPQSSPVNTVAIDPQIPVFQPEIPSRPGSESSQPNNLGSQLVFSRFGPEETSDVLREVQSLQHRSKRTVTYKVDSSSYKNSPPLSYKDFVLGKRIVKQKADKKLNRGRRQAADLSGSIKDLDRIRNSPSLKNPALFADAIVHKIDLTVNEQGTEGGAATTVYLTRTGTDVVFRVETPFLLLIRHDATKLPLFYGSVYEPTV